VDRCALKTGIARGVWRLALVVVVLASFTGCAVSEFSLSGVGDRVLRVFEFSPPGKVVSAGKSVVAFTEEISPEEEYYIGRAVAAKILATYPLSTNQSLVRYVENVGFAVAVASDVPETFGGYHFAVLESEVPNAIAAPGGFVFVTTGLLKLLPNEDALAAVLGHEIVHVVDQHGLKSISRDRLAAAVADIAKVAASINCNELLSQSVSVFGGVVDDIVSTLLNRGYSQEQEFSADAGGMTFMARVGFDPRQMDTVLGVMTRMPPADEGWFRSHPGPDARRAEVKALLEKRGFRGYVGGSMERRERYRGVVGLRAPGRSKIKG
jgi:predicted Zn-dependent protease